MPEPTALVFVQLWVESVLGRGTYLQNMEQSVDITRGLDRATRQ
jgi:hypothetical protein